MKDLAPREFNYANKEHSLKIDDEADFFTAFKGKKDTTYYIVYISQKYSLEQLNIKYDLILYDSSIYGDVAPSVEEYIDGDPEEPFIRNYDYKWYSFTPSESKTYYIRIG